ncbi:MAG: 16S rRNA (adenine(1518)-N(6)/adenine(1519)-N(6))-dimethyltransferase RsmA [Atopobiaceae bacterium]|jgi:16S rRNA (adenine1518-N6/adenine1519-N6)-dimethyltransferase|nr:16S rRNA (adenine(1518)-N(6)/adenine(1519)-N(6))-dimethyltransferase RsmA [Atopobiaceae bacterium]
MPVFSWLASPRETRGVLESYGLATKHHLGQNFLVNDAIIGKILGLAELGDTDVVFEVGPGIGTLTVAMLPAAGAVVSVEADRGLEPVLAETCARDSERFALVMGDALKVTPETLTAAVASLGIDGLAPEPTKLVSNLPYQVAATVVLRSFEQMPALRRAVVMVQAEVADRMAASPGSKAYGGYTAKLALYARPTGRFEVGPGNFMPPPHVDSAVIRLDRASMADPATGEPLTAGQIAWCAQVIDAAFAQRRKTIRNSMGASGFDKAELDAAFAATGIEARSRAEVLAPEDFVRLAGALGWR